MNGMPAGYAGFDDRFPTGASPLRYDQTFPGGNRHANHRQRSSRVDSMPVTTVAGGYAGNPYLCGTHLEAPARPEPQYMDSYTAQSMMRYGYGHPYNPQHHLSARPYNHNLANGGQVYAAHHKTECRPRYFYR
eukprot:TRINITY_DN1655_c0_g1_i1.p2 TRINITY_DN1655_c0_g1~~TRINITY_DN1655_c0_g1_i1.p2  ORF type:complete len:133 (+),score=10.61 TRINITY_DN1655_c0_g1_i1:182-580(+)